MSEQAPTGPEHATRGNARLTDWLVVVPARLGSERLPRKPLLLLGGLPLIVRVVQNLAPLAARGAVIVVATDAAEVAEACAAHGITACMTDSAHQSGTDRCAEAAAGYPHPFILNVQGDEPHVDPAALFSLMAAVSSRSAADMGTLVVRQTDLALAADPNAVKAVRAASGYALYFSRSCLPYDRTGSGPGRGHVPASFWHHLGVYAFRRERLNDFVRLGPSPLELTEKLEQLRALEAGWRIWLTEAEHFARGIDTPEDLEAARARFAQ